MARISTGDVVRLTYTVKLATGEVIDTSDAQVAQANDIFHEGRRYEPLTVQVGTGRIIPGLDRNLMGMEEGEMKEITILPEEAYGTKDSALLARLPRDLFEQHDIQPAVGMVVQTDAGQGHVTAVSQDTVEVDYNHPLAGETLFFSVKVESVSPA